ncbi:MAG TPA: SBBP repeat-containing protein [Bacteroidia bacterium]|jgi:hypothetical protein
MKKNVLILIGLLVSIQIYAQVPSLQWVKDFSGPGQSMGISIASDTSGNVYTVGNFEGLCDFDPGSDTFNLYATPVPTTTAYDIFISKLSSSGDFEWAKRVGNSSAKDFAKSIVIDQLNNLYVLGNSMYSGMFVLKLDNSGNVLWSKSCSVEGSSMQLDNSDNLYIGCEYMGTVDFDPGAGVFNLTSNGNKDVAVIKLDSVGDFVWAKSMGGADWDFGGAIAVDDIGNVYIAGEFMGSGDFDPGIGTQTLVSPSAGYTDVFISKLNSAGDFIWGKSFGGVMSNDRLKSIGIDGLQNVYLYGGFEDSVDFDSGIGIEMLSSAGNADVFISKLDSLGNFAWVKGIGGTSYESPGDLKIDESGNVYTLGSFNLTCDFDPGPDNYEITAANFYDVFITKFNALGEYIWAGSFGGSSQEFGFGLAIDHSDNIYSTGYFHETVDFDPGAGIANLTSVGSSPSGFVHKMNYGLVGIVENSPKTHIDLYPNPTNGIFTIAVPALPKGSIVEIYNCLGALVYKKNITNELNTIDLTNQTDGIYFVKIISENQLISQKMIKQ